MPRLIFPALLRLTLLGVAVVLAWVALPASAHAGRGMVTVDLRPEAGDVPTHLCVVSSAPGPRTRQQLWDILEKEPVAGAGNARRWRMDPAAWGATTAAPGDRCAADPTADCRAEVELPQGVARDAELHVACTADTLFAEADGARDPRVLVVFLEQLDASPPAIESVRLTGGIANIGLVTLVDRAVITARSMGGHYLPHRRSFREGETRAAGTKTIAPFPITPRCQWTEVTLPRTRLRPQDRERLSVWVHGSPIDVSQCVRDLSGDVFRVRIPKAPLGVGSVEVELKQDATAGARFGARWDGAWPPVPFDLQFHQLTFSWRRPECVYPSDQCPVATLETGTVCQSDVTPNGCAYRCPGEHSQEGAVDSELPLEVTFEKASPRQRWTDKLAQNGQELSSYVPAEAIHLGINVEPWRTELPGNEIRKLRIFQPDGVQKDYPVTRTSQIELKIPGASCEPIRFEIIGDRKYEEGLAIVKDGRLDATPPERLAKIVSFNVLLALGGGPAWTIGGRATASGTPQIFFNGMLQFAMKFRPRKPKLARLGFEARVAGMVGQWGAVVFEDETGDMTSFEDFVWVRFFAGPGLVADLSSRVAVGAGFDLGTSFPARSQQTLQGGNFTFIMSPNLDVRLRVRRWLSLLLQFRGVVDKAFESQDTTMMMTTGTKRRTAFTLNTMFGVMGSF